jgi:hypothetical protein
MWETAAAAAASAAETSSMRATAIDTALRSVAPPTSVWRRKLNLKATFESGQSRLSFKRIVPGAFNTSLIGSTCTAYLG